MLTPFQEDAAAGPKTALAKTGRCVSACFPVLRKAGKTSGKERASITRQTGKSCPGTDHQILFLPNCVLNLYLINNSLPSKLQKTPF
jgi:hypothetical protein